MNASWDIEIVRAGRSRSSSMPCTHLTSPKLVIPYFAFTLSARAVSSFLEPIATQLSTQKPAAAKSRSVQEFLMYIAGSLGVAVNPSLSMWALSCSFHVLPDFTNPYKPFLRRHTQSPFPGAT